MGEDGRANLAGRLAGGLGSAMLGLITFDQVVDTIILTAIGALISGFFGFMVTKALQWGWRKANGGDKDRK